MMLVVDVLLEGCPLPGKMAVILNTEPRKCRTRMNFREDLWGWEEKQTLRLLLMAAHVASGALGEFPSGCNLKWWGGRA